MVDNIEFAQVELKVVEGLKTGNSCLEEMHKIMSLEDVEQIMADTQEAIEYQRVYRKAKILYLYLLTFTQ